MGNERLFSRGPSLLRDGAGAGLFAQDGEISDRSPRLVGLEQTQQGSGPRAVRTLPAVARPSGRWKGRGVMLRACPAPPKAGVSGCSQRGGAGAGAGGSRPKELQLSATQQTLFIYLFIGGGGGAGMGSWQGPYCYHPPGRGMGSSMGGRSGPRSGGLLPVLGAGDEVARWGAPCGLALHVTHSKPPARR